MEIEKEEFLSEIIDITNTSDKCVPLIIKHIKEQIKLRALGGNCDYEVCYGMWINVAAPNANISPREYCYPCNRLVDIAVSYFKEQGFTVEHQVHRYRIGWGVK